MSKARCVGIATSVSDIEFAKGVVTCALSYLIEKQQTHECARLVLIDAKRNLTDHRNAVLAKNAADPKALGSNEAAREASISALVAHEITDLDRATREEIAASGQVTLAKLNLDRAKVQFDAAVQLASLSVIRTNVSIANAQLESVTGLVSAR